MARLFPFRPDRTEVSREPRLVDLDDNTADDVFAALSSDTARAILSRLYEEPATASDVAEAVDTSLQNARYHLDKLRDAGLIEDVDTWYSSRGTEMTVYAPTNEPLVVAAGREESTGVLRDALKRVLGSVGVLALASVLVDRLARTTSLAPGVGFGGAAGGDGDDLEYTGDAERNEASTESGENTGTDTPAPEDDADVGALDTAEAGAPNTETPPAATETQTPATTGTPVDGEATQTAEATRDVAGTTTVTPEATATPDPTLDAATATDPGTTATSTVAMTDGGGLVDAAATLPPGLLFFAGGLLMIALGAGWWYAARYRRGLA